MFPNHEKKKHFWRYQICKFYQYITSRLVFMIVFGIPCNCFMVLSIRLKTCRSKGFFIFYMAKCALPKHRVSLRGFTRPNASDRHWACNLSRSAIFTLLLLKGFNHMIVRIRFKTFCETKYTIPFRLIVPTAEQ